MSHWWLLALVAAGCAQAQTGGRTNGSTGGTKPDLAMPADVDLGNAPEPDLAGVDLAGADLRRPPGDMAELCDVITQTGCMGSNVKCSLTSLGPTCLADGTVPIAGLCGDSMTPPASSDQCSKGSACISFTPPGGGAAVSFCHEYCNLDGDCGQPAVAGGLPPRCDVETMAGTKFCTTSCKPFGAINGNNGCPMGTTCRYEWDLMAMTEGTRCGPLGAVAEGGDCKMATCDVGMVCVSTSATDVKCRRVCENAGNCVGGQACMPPFNGATLKICIQ